jgi:ubiquinone/menaquinone biosynthesis C-methylase UbiE
VRIDPDVTISSAGSNGAPAKGAEADAGLERFDPPEGAGKLIDSEHRGRYWWAAQAVEGKDVLDAGCGLGYGLDIFAAAGAAKLTGVDIDEQAVAQARSRFAAFADSFLRADLCALALPDSSFDVVVCFETIQQVSDGERALGELRRVLRPGGVLLISSPSPDVYTGNEHHVHEYRPTELSAVIEERFDNVAAYRQHPWLASTIVPAGGGTAPRRHHIRTTTEIEPGAETYSILAASDGELPSLEALVTLGHDFEVKWWAEQLAAAERAAEQREAAAEGRARERIAELEGRLSQAGDRADAAAQEVTALAAKQDELHRDLAAAEAREQAVRARLQESATALLDANQSLARLPALQHRYEELEALRAHVEMLEGSHSWRYMAPARWLRHTLRLQR